MLWSKWSNQQKCGNWWYWSGGWFHHHSGQWWYTACMWDFDSSNSHCRWWHMFRAQRYRIPLCKKYQHYLTAVLHQSILQPVILQLGTCHQVPTVPDGTALLLWPEACLEVEYLDVYASTSDACTAFQSCQRDLHTEDGPLLYTGVTTAFFRA